MEVSALKYAGTAGMHGRSPLLRLQSDERLIAYVRRGNNSAFEVLVNRYEARLLSFCRHLLGSREDAEDVLQEVFAAAFNAILADDRAINVRPWLYRIARNRSLNHLRRIQAIGVDTMDVHFSDHGASTADKVHSREEFRVLVGDIQDLPETQRTALLLREMDALSYEQIAEAMETTVPSVKSLLVRARVSLAEAAESRLLSCDDVRIELGEAAEGLRRRPSALVRRHLKTCDRCSNFRVQLRDTNKALAALLPIGPLIILKKLLLVHLSHSASAGSSATAAGGGATAAGTTLVGGSAASGILSAGMGAVASKAAAGLAAAALVTAGAVEVDHSSTHRAHHRAIAASPAYNAAAVAHPAVIVHSTLIHKTIAKAKHVVTKKTAKTATKAGTVLVASTLLQKQAGKAALTAAATKKKKTAAPVPPGRTQTQSDETILPTTPTSTTPTPIVSPPTSTGGNAPTPDALATTPPTGTPEPTAAAPGGSDPGAGGGAAPGGTSDPGGAGSGAVDGSGTSGLLGTPILGGTAAPGGTPAPSGTAAPSGSPDGSAPVAPAAPSH